MRCAETTFRSWGTPKPSSCVAACCMVSQSESLPITMPTKGFVICVSGIGLAVPRLGVG